MLGQASGLTALRLAGLALAAVLLLAGMWALWRARHRAEAERVHMPVLGRIGVPTCLTLGLSFLAAGYHALAYSLPPGVTLWAVPPRRWWIVATAIVVAMASSLASDWLERRHEDGSAG